MRCDKFDIHTFYAPFLEIRHIHTFYAPQKCDKFDIHAFCPPESAINADISFMP